MKNILITGCFHSLNSGVMAMAEAIIQKKTTDKIFVLSSERFLAEDKLRYSIYNNVELIVPPWKKGDKCTKLLKSLMGIAGVSFDKDFLNILKKIDIIYDISGDSISDDYGTIGILFQLIPLSIAIAHGKKVIIAPQSIGPFNNFLQKFFAKKILSGVSKIYLRESESIRYLDSLKGLGFVELADLAFLLKPRQPDNPAEIPRKTMALGVSDLLSSFSNENISLYESIIDRLLDRGFTALLVTHVSYPSSNDLLLGEKVKGKYKNDDRVIFLEKNLRASEWKFLIGKCDGIISGRMHPIVAALSQTIPALNISYNHKSKGVVQNRFFPFGNIVSIKKGSQEILSCVDVFLNFLEEGYDKKAFSRLTSNNISLAAKVFPDEY